MSFQCNVRLSAIAFVSIWIIACGHFNLKEPMPYNPIDCHLPDCRTPFPLIWRDLSRNLPGTAPIWRRGQQVDIHWHRNNHEGGFYRRSLVPVKHMFDRSWHLKTAFEWGCWSQGLFHCGSGSVCGTDKIGYAYSNRIHVPKVFPDGDYVFGMVWYGGLHWTRTRAFFPNYNTCAFVRIRGGYLSNRYTPRFISGKNIWRNIPAGKCVTSKNFVGECHGQCCFGNHVRTTVPGVFQNGQNPRILFMLDVEQGVGINESVIFADDLVKRGKLEEFQEKQAEEDKLIEEKQLYSTKDE